MKNRSYSIRVKDILDKTWAEQSQDISITHDLEQGETIITIAVKDQAMLHGLLRKINNLGLVLISVSQIEEEN